MLNDSCYDVNSLWLDFSHLSMHYKALERYFLGKMKTCMLIIIKLSSHTFNILGWIPLLPSEDIGSDEMIFLLIPVTWRPKAVDCVNCYW